MHTIIFLLTITIGIISCSSISDTQTTAVTKKDHFKVQIGHHSLQSTDYLSRQLKFHPTKTPIVMWDVETPPCPKGWHIPDDIEWIKLRDLLIIGTGGEEQYKKIYGVTLSSKFDKNMLPKDMVNHDSLVIKDLAVRFYSSSQKQQGFNLKKAPKQWSSAKHKTTINAFRLLQPELKAKAYSLNTNLPIPVLTRYSCLCIED